ncbi:hypothetical protein LTS17_001423 [Exophiala oligosperma]
MACHCTHCRKGAGGPYQTNAAFRSTDVDIRDEASKLTKYTFPGDDVCSGYSKEKWFCNTCGCTIFIRPMKHDGDVVVLKTSILERDLENCLRPKMEYFVTKRCSYVASIPEAKQFDAMP